MGDVKKPLVLIVDEIPSIIRLLELELSVQGFATAGCGIGEDAFDAIEELKPDAILLEIVLPGMNGLDMLVQLKQRYKLPVIMLTTMNSEADRALAFDLGADDFIQKPFDPQELGQRVAAVVDGHQSELRTIQHGDLSLDLTRRLARRNSEIVSLTTNEWAVLLALSLRPRQWVPVNELLVLVAGADSPVNRQLLLPVIARLRETLEANAATPQVLVGDLDVGYMLKLDVQSSE
jgi:DNA-binding response OmpR family regulator